MNLLRLAPLVLLLLSRGAAAAAEVGPLPVVLHVAEEDAPDGPRPVQEPAWVDAQVTEANRIFEPHGLSLVVRSRRALPAAQARLETRADRDALAKALTPGAINVFIVASLRDVDDPALHRMGVHWRQRRDRSRRYIIVAGSAVPTVLAHELGHYLGNGHSDVPDNLMSYGRKDDLIFLDKGL